ncbi:Hypothetical protein SMAX5B_016215 [Scophthalmus maximus]|uniref:Uncharacterized protein n=1 Tax=Scophthalmus maximus TaxID=52904 RepID=A0A2U9BLA6_SCOMX|nr:Hypothetical protein SMAX5B_016215 [Scophthalmus maximus]
MLSFTSLMMCSSHMRQEKSIKSARGCKPINQKKKKKKVWKTQSSIPTVGSCRLEILESIGLSGASSTGGLVHRALCTFRAESVHKHDSVLILYQHSSLPPP